MILLIASLLALFVGPLLISILGQPSPLLLQAMDAFVLVAIGGLVVLHIIPDCLSDNPLATCVALLLGLALPIVLHRHHQHKNRHQHGCHKQETKSLLTIGTLGIALHAFFDGVALVEHPHFHIKLALAVVLHRVLEGFGLYWLAYPLYGKRGTLLLLCSVALGTTLGFACGDMAYQHGFATWIYIVQAAVTGSLLHVLLHSKRRAEPAQKNNVISVIGGLCGILFLCLL